MELRNKKSLINSSSISTSSLLNNFKPSFPPEITVDELIFESLKKGNSNYNRTPRFNPFIIYRRVFNREASKLNRDLSVQQISKKASESWHRESEHVKKIYRKLAEDAKIGLRSHRKLAKNAKIGLKSHRKLTKDAKIGLRSRYNISNLNMNQSNDNVSEGLGILCVDSNYVDDGNDQINNMNEESTNCDSVSISGTKTMIQSVNSFNFKHTPIQPIQFTKSHNPLNLSTKNRNGIRKTSIEIAKNDIYDLKINKVRSCQRRFANGASVYKNKNQILNFASHCKEDNLAYSTITFKSLIKEIQKNKDEKDEYNIFHEFSKNPEKKVPELSDQIEVLLKKYEIKKYEYSQVDNIQHIDRGGSAIVYSAYLQGKKYALKSLDVSINLSWDNKKFKKFLQELRFIHNIEHPNIIKFYGVLKDPQSGNFNIILQLANDGNLRDYLRHKWSTDGFKILWTELTIIAKEITLGLKFLHEKGIIHQDLHSKNILIDHGKPLITDFGISKHIEDFSLSTSYLKGMAAYIEPQCFIQHGKKVRRDERSDIYSLGVVLWELTSGTNPFSDSYNHAIPVKIFIGEREKMIPGTPKGLSTETTVEFIINKIYNKPHIDLWQ
ncbi:kinase-like protein [Gigaspora margarita]|uniref:Kinase-like protein n=1 Tax=Gigaspora margarita TaxID=4874 RepID=A0A8H4A2X0_GIGMA|nr:kinase-like protein [Gigaspora margarita]